MTKKVSYLLDYLPDIPDQEPSARLYNLLDYAERLLKSGIKNPTQKHGLFLLNCFNQESRWARRFITDELSKMETLTLETKTDFQKSFTDYILQIRKWMQNAMQSGKIDRLEFDRLGDIRCGLFQLLITFNQDCQNKLNTEIRRLIEQNRKDVAGHKEFVDEAALRNVKKDLSAELNSGKGETERKEILEIKPGIFGVAINVKELWRQRMEIVKWIGQFTKKNAKTTAGGTLKRSLWVIKQKNSTT